MLHDAGIYVMVPSPQRYAIHKLIISQRRKDGAIKRDKDIQQAEALLDIIWQKRPHELKLAWEEAYQRGNKWRQPLIEGMGNLTPRVRDGLLKVVDHTPNFLKGIDLSFSNPTPHYDFSRDIITFTGDSLGGTVQCAISRETMDDYFGTDGLDQNGRIERFLRNKSAIELLARTKYLSWPIEEPGAVLIKTVDVPKLQKHNK